MDVTMSQSVIQISRISQARVYDRFKKEKEGGKKGEIKGIFQRDIIA